MTTKKTTKKVTKRSRKPAAERNGHVQDGVIEVKVQGGKLDGKTLTFDPLIVKLTAEGLEAKHKLEEQDGRIIPTADFAAELADSLGCTPIVALHVWAKAAEYFYAVQKKTNSLRT